MATKNSKQGKGCKRPRKPKRSLGIHGGGGRTRLSPLQKVLLGKGQFATWKPLVDRGAP